MNTLGFDIASKFPGLKNFDDTINRSLFKSTIQKGFSGLVLYHGIPDDEGTVRLHGNILENTLLPAVNEQRCAVLIIDTRVITRPQSCPSPYIHFYSASVPNVDPKEGEFNPLEPRFQDLVDSFATLSALPDIPAIKQLWSQVDPFSDRLKLLRLLEEILYSQKDNEETVDRDLLAKLLPLYGNRISTFDEAKAEYFRLCEEDDLKKKMNHWQVQRDFISHQLFHHGFYALLYRPTIIRALEDDTQCLPDSLLPVLQNWQSVREPLIVLLDTAVPYSIADCELAFASIHPKTPHSIAVIEKYRQTYGPTIESFTRPIMQTVDRIDNEVETLTKCMLARPSSVRQRSSLLDLCLELSRQLSQLKHLESIGDGNA